MGLKVGVPVYWCFLTAPRIQTPPPLNTKLQNEKSRTIAHLKAIFGTNQMDYVIISSPVIAILVYFF